MFTSILQFNTVLLQIQSDNTVMKLGLQANTISAATLGLQ